MKSLTQPALWRVLNSYGAPDAYFTEFVRIHSDFLIDDKFVEECIASAGQSQVWIQLMGNDIASIVRNVNFLQKFPISGIDFNVGCPMPKIFKKNAGGGLLRDLQQLEKILNAIRESCGIPMCVKTRIGFYDASNFSEILDLIQSVRPDLFVLHARTVKQLYSGEPQYDYIETASKVLKIPVIANGNIDSVELAGKIIDSTGCNGIMIGRAAIANPWIFKQWKNYVNDQKIYTATFDEYVDFLLKIYNEFNLDKKHEQSALGVLKNFASYIIPNMSANKDFGKNVLISSSLKEFWTAISNKQYEIL